jgi:thioredoxin reductase (NADPH)
LVGGGNSAGQAAVFLAGFAAKVSILVRDDGIATTMSRYLVDRIEATANVEVRTRTEIRTLIRGADAHLGRVRWRHTATGGRRSCPSATSFSS